MPELKRLKLSNKLRLMKIANRELDEESKVIYEDLKQTRNEVEERTTEMQNEFFMILGNMKLLKDNKKDNWIELLSKYIDEQYEILKKDLFDDCESDEQTIKFKILK